MYWPTCPKDGEYICRLYEGEWLDPDKYLADHPEWRDPTGLPRAVSEKRAVEKKKQEDPLTKTGIVGDFCRAYPIRDAIEKFLPDIYAPTMEDDRYDYIPGEGVAGV